MKEAAATRTRETTAEVKNPRLIGAMPLASFLPGLLARTPTTEAMMPMAATTRGKTMPSAPKKTWPRMRASTRVTA